MHVRRSPGWPLALTIAQVNYVFDRALSDPDALLDRYTTLTGWSEALAEAGADRVIVAQRFSRNARLTRRGVDYIFYRDDRAAHPRPWTWPRRLHQAVARTRPDVVHVNGLIFPIQTWLLRRVLPHSTALVVQDHGSDEPLVSGTGTRRRIHLPGYLRRRGLRAADGFLFAADGQELTWRDAGLIAPTQPVYRVMEASTTLRPIARDAARRASGVDGAPAILWVGRLNANKDPLTVLDGFERSLAWLPNATLTMIYSADDLLPAVRQHLGASAALERRVRLVADVPHHLMASFYSAADIFVLGSHHEGSGYALLEALACGVAPVVTSIPTFRAMTKEGQLGALWPPGDAAACSRALLKVERDDAPSRRLRISQHFKRELSWPAIGREALEAYRTVVTKRRAIAAGLDAR